MILMVYSCKETEPETEVPLILEGSWQVVAYEHHETGLVLTHQYSDSWMDSLETIMYFNEDLSPHIMSGDNTTNFIQVEYDYISEDEIQFGGLLSTQINQPAWGNYFNLAIAGDPWKIDLSDTGLRMYYNNMTNSVLFEKVE